MAVDDVIGIQIHGRYQMQNVVNVMQYKITEQTADNHELLGKMCLAWETSHKTVWLGRHIDSYRLMGLKGFSLTGLNKRPGLVHIDEAGSVVGVETPSPICRVITMYTDSPNYRRRGRVMLSGSEDTMFGDDDGAVVDAELALLAILGTALMADLDDGSNAAEPGLAPHGLLEFEKFTAVQARRTPACIRSRRVRGFSVG